MKEKIKESKNNWQFKVCISAIRLLLILYFKLDSLDYWLSFPKTKSSVFEPPICRFSSQES